MVTVKFTQALKRFYPLLKEQTVEATSLLDVIQKLNIQYVGIQAYILDEQNQLRKHVNIFINNNLIEDRKTLTDRIKSGDEIYFMQALSGG